MKYLHTMVRVSDIDASLNFYCNLLGLEEVRRRESERGRFTLIFLAAPGQTEAQVELTYNWDPEEYTGGRNFGHLAYAVDDIYAICQRLQDGGWPSCAPPTASASSCFRAARRSSQGSRGSPWATRAPGSGQDVTLRAPSAS